MEAGVRGEVAAGKLKDLRRRIERWRRTRRARGAMPAELWAEAVGLGREFGAYRVARDVGIGYQSLRDRLGDGGGAEAAKAPGFVEVSTASLFGFDAAAARGEVELSDGRGVRMVIRLGAGESVDVAALLAAFRAG